MEHTGAKYRLLSKKVSAKGHKHLNMMQKFYRIEAIRDIPRHNVKAGELGGLVSSALTLSQEGDCWIGKESVVQSSSKMEAKGISSVQGNALVSGKCHAKNSIITDDVIIDAKSAYLKDSKVNDNATIIGDDVSIVDSYLVEKSKVKAFNSENYACLSITNSYLGRALIEAEGEIANVSTRELFEASGSMKIRFNKQDKILRNLSKPFRANGRIFIDYFNLMGTTVELTGKVALESGIVHDGNLKVADSSLRNVHGSGIIEVTGGSKVYSSKLNGVNIIKDGVTIHSSSTLTGTNSISGTITLPKFSRINNQNISMDKNGLIEKHDSDPDQINEVQVKTKQLEAEHSRLQREIETLTKTLNANISSDAENIDDIDIYKDIIRAVEADYEAYSTDVVKLIKYPAMVDSSVPETQELMLKLRSARRFIKVNNASLLEKSALELEQAFIRAENNAYKIAATFLSEKERAGLKRADKALAIALDENANEHERRAGYKSGMKSLEGVLPLSEQAVFALKEKIGLKEIEA